MKTMHTQLILSALALVLVAGCASNNAGRFARIDNKQFYDADGKFDAEAAKRVYLNFLKQHGHPVNDAIADAPFITVKTERILRVGEIAAVSRPLEKHWMQAGPEGAVFTEFSTFHTGEAVRFTDPKIKF